MGYQRIARRFVATITAVAVAACGVFPGAPKPPANMVQVRPPVAFRLAETPPSFAVEATLRGKGEGAKHGASSAAWCLEPRLYVIGNIICLPFALAIGAALGTNRTASLEQLRVAEQSLSATMAKSLPTDALLREARLYAGRYGITSDESGGGASGTVIELGLTRLRATTPGESALPYRFILTVHGKLIESASGRVLDEFDHELLTDEHSVDAWAADEGRLLVEALRGVAREAAETFIDDWVIAYRGKPLPPPSPGFLTIPNFVLAPAPPLDTLPGFLNDASAEVDADAARLAWSPLPASFVADATGPALRFEDLSYEVRLYETVVRSDGLLGKWHEPGPFMRAFDGIRSPTFTVPEVLQRCKAYYWTVRARFSIEGDVRVTEWSGRWGYHDPAQVRRFKGYTAQMLRPTENKLESLTLPDMRAHFHLVRTPGPCK